MPNTAVVAREAIELTESALEGTMEGHSLFEQVQGVVQSSILVLRDELGCGLDGTDGLLDRISVVWFGALSEELESLLDVRMDRTQAMTLRIPHRLLDGLDLCWRGYLGEDT